MNAVQMMLLFGVLLFAGCCGPTGASESSGSCSLGTYGSACTDLCDRMGGEDCFTKCMDEVRAQGLGDATTCCKSTYRQNCEQICNEYGSYGMDECMSDCAGQFSSLGFSLDSCALPV